MKQNQIPQSVIELMVKAAYGDRASKAKLAKILRERIAAERSN